MFVKCSLMLLKRAAGMIQLLGNIVYKVIIENNGSIYDLYR